MKISDTLERTKRATLAVIIPHPHPSKGGFPTPNGTGFFISPNGYFLTARHVIEKLDQNGGKVAGTNGIPELYERKQVNLFLLMGLPDSVYVTDIEIVKDWPEFDLVLLKADIQKNQNGYLKGKESFDFLEIDLNTVVEGEDIYSFGYPLADHEIDESDEEGIVSGSLIFYPRATSAIVSSHYEVMPTTMKVCEYPKHYVIDKALNYGNSGGPLLVVETGKVFSVCSRFQPVFIPQLNGSVMTPSLYGITTSIKNIEEDLKSLNIL